MGDLGVANPIALNDGPKEEINVLVTGFGPWRNFAANPSHLITAALPTILPTAAHLPTVHIHPLPVPLRVSYATVRHLIPPLLFPDPDAAHAILPPPPGLTPQPANPTPALAPQPSNPLSIAQPASSTSSNLLPPPGRPHAESAHAILPPPPALVQHALHSLPIRSREAPIPSLRNPPPVSSKLPPAGRPHADSAPPALPSLALITQHLPKSSLPPPPAQPVQAVQPQQPIALPPPTPAALDPKPNFDLVLFIGMAQGRNYYTLETQAHRDGYAARDEDGRTLEADKLWKGWGAPEMLKMGFCECKEKVLEAWRAGLDEDVRLSDDAGRYLCDFVFYTGLVEYWRRRKEGEDGEDAPVVFLHVPGETEDKNIRSGVRVAEGLIKALVETRWGRGKGGNAQ